MKIKTLLVFVLCLISAVAFGQNGGIKGKVVSRTTRNSIENVKINLSPGDERMISNDKGEFEFNNLQPGEYMLTFEAPEYETLNLPVRVAGTVREVNAIMAVDRNVANLDDGIFAEFDNETMEDAQNLPTSLSASKDVFNNIASYNFSEMRFNVRGYDSQYSDTYLNGIYFNDAMSGYGPWSLWSGLNDMTRNQEVTSGMVMGNMGVGTIGGSTNINTMPSQMRKGFRASFVNGNAMYRFRGMVSYASGLQDNGWSYAVSASTRQGGNDYVHGVFYNAFGYFLAVEKRFNDQHRLALTLLGAPTQRGTQQAATQEAYDLVGNNYYNPNWGWQDGKRRNARVRNFHEPIAMLNYTFDIDDRTQLNAAASFRFGQNGYSSLTWYAGPDPRPDYYRYMPSFYNGTTTGAWLYEAWRTNTDDIRHIDWNHLYEINRNQPVDETYGSGHRSMNMIEERHADQLDFNFATQFSHIFRNNTKVLGGVTLRRNRTSYYSEVKDLLGGDYWVDVDKFAERDNAGLNPIPYQNDMDYYNKYGHARAAVKGDRYGYNYYGNVFDVNVWGQYNFAIQKLDVTLGAQVGHNTMWRHGLWQKGLFLDDSKGDSKNINNFTYTLKGNFLYKLSAAHSFEANIAWIQEPPVFQYAFVSPRTRNQENPGLSSEKILSFDASYNLRLGDLKARLTGYYTKFMDESKVISYYDDIEATYSNFAMSGIDKKHFGLELAASIPLYEGLQLNGALSWGQYTYDNNPHYVQIQDNSGAIQNEGRVYWKNFRVESTPQTAAHLGLSYRTRNNIYLSLDGNYYNNMYLSMNPIYRTDEVLSSNMSEQEIKDLRHQEEFSHAFVMNASIGKNWYINRKYTVGFNLDVNNLLNDQNIKSGGYEQIRLYKNKEESIQKYEAFDAKYFYMFGTTYYLNVYFRF